MPLPLHRRRLGKGILRQVEITTYAPLGCGELVRLGILLLIHAATLRPSLDAASLPVDGPSKAVVTTHRCPRTPPRRPRGDRRQTRDIATGDRALRLRKRLSECITVGSQVLLESGMDYVSGTATLDFGNQPKRRMIVLVDAKWLGSKSRHSVTL